MSKRQPIRFTLAILLAFLSAQVLHADILTVTNTADAGVGSLRGSIDSAAAGDTIVLDGALSGAIFGLTSGELVLDKNLLIVGLGGSNTAINAGGLSRTFRVDSGVTAEIRGFTLALGFAGGTGENANGGGIYNAGNLVLTDVKVLGGIADSLGGAIYSSGSLSCSETVLKNGFALKGGGAYIASGSLGLFDFKVEDNEAEEGAGLWLGGSSTILTAGIVKRNAASVSHGGGIYAVSGSLVASRISFDDNTTLGSGGALYSMVDVAVTRSTFAGNTADADGGAFYATSSAGLSAENCTWSSNSAGGNGGAAYVAQEILCRSNTFTANNADNDGGAVFLVPAFELRIIDNSILSGNTVADTLADDIANASSIFTSAYNLYGVVDDGAFSAGAGDLIGASAMLDVLADNGGDTRTHALLCGSAAINAANPALASTQDQRGLPRMIDGRSDIGALEKQDTCAAAPVCSIDSVALGVQGACNPLNDEYSQEVIVYSAAAPSTGSLSVNGQLFAVDADTVLLTGLVSDGQSVALAVLFTEDSVCAFAMDSAWMAPESCLPPPCSIDSVALGVQGACNPLNDEYSQEVIVYSTSAPAAGTLSVNGQLFAVDADTVLLTGLVSDGQSVALTVLFTEDSVCAFAMDSAWTAPESCLPPPCSIDSVVLSTQSACDPAFDTYSQSLIVYSTSGPVSGNLSVNGVLFAADADTVVLADLPSNGLPVDLNVLFTEDSACAFALDSAWTAPDSCFECTAQTPVNIVANFNSVTRNMDLSWDPVPTTLGCQVSGRPLGAPSFAQIRRPGLEVTSAFVPEPQLTPGLSYEWFVNCACAIPPTGADLTNSSVIDTFTYPDTAVTALCDADSLPDMLSSTFVSADSSVILGWNPPEGMINCRVNIRPLGAPAFALRVVDGNPPTADTLPASGLNPGTTYEWKVKCSCSVPPLPGEETDFSVTDTFSYLAPRLANPDALGALQLLPNPATTQVVLEAADFPAGAYELELMDMAGRVHRAWTGEQESMGLRRVLALDGVPAGTYLLRIIHREGVQSLRVQIVE